MGKNLRDKNPNNSSGNEHSPGCVWGLLHMMKYHHWHYVKKRLVHKRHRGNKHAVGVGIPGSCTGNACMPEDTDAKSDKSNGEEKTRQSIPAGIHSVKARIKARIAGEMSKKKGRHNRASSCPVRSQLKRTESMHRLEPPPNLYPIAEMVLNENSPRIVHHGNEKSCATRNTSNLASLSATSYERPISGNNDCCGDSCPLITRDRTVHDKVNENKKDHTFIEEKLDDDRMQDMFEKKLIHVKELDADASLHHPKEYLEALDIINVNKELLVKILHDPGSPLAAHFHNQQAVSAKMGLTKSESFPVKLRHKHELTGSPLIEESKSKNSIKTKKLAGSSSLKYAGERSIPSIIEHNADGIQKLNQTIADSSASGTSESLRNQGENRVAIKRFKDLRQKIKYVIKESKQERHMIAMDAILHKVPHGQKLTKEMEQEIINHSKDPAMNRQGKHSPASSYDSDHSVSTIKKKQQHHMRRASSLNASLDKYCELYETSCNREAKCQTTSERLKLRNERVGSPLRSVPKTLGRIFSLPEIKSYNYQDEESSDVFSSGARAVVDGNASRRSSFDEQNSVCHSTGSENHMQLDAPLESEIKNLAGGGEFKAVSRDKVASTSVVNSEKSAPVDSIVNDIESLTEPFPISMPEFNVSLSEGAQMEIKPQDGIESLAKLEHDSPNDTPKPVHMDTEKIGSPMKHLRYDMTQVRVDERDLADFNYVRDVLEQSRFNGNESLGTWHSDEQPVDPLMYGDTEGCLVHDPDCSGNEEGGKCDHYLLFDLINEVLMEIYGRSYNYCPVALSSLCHIPLMPAGHHVLKEVWALVSWNLSLRPEVDQSLDYSLSRDLEKSDGWMNLQFDSECIGIELEDLIFDELLEEVLCV
ncbi:unnamed protein product [Malus baccata var. baccata]